MTETIVKELNKDDDMNVIINIKIRFHGLNLRVLWIKHLLKCKH